MIFFTVMDDLGDGTCIERRFKTREEAQKWRDKMENDPYFQQDGDGSPVLKQDTDSPSFWHEDDDDL